MSSHPPFISDPADDQDQELRIAITRRDRDTAVVHLAGEADISTAGAVAQALCDAVERGRRRVVVDLDQLSFLDAVTLDVLVAASRQAWAAGRTLQVRCASPFGRRLLTIAGLDDLLEQDWISPDR